MSEPHTIPASMEIASENLPIWPLQDAKNRFSAVVKAAAAGPAQLVTVHGVPAAVVMSPLEFERLRQGVSPQGSLSAALLSPCLDEPEAAVFERDRRSNPNRDWVL
jgi:antitoxin Phd